VCLISFDNMLHWPGQKANSQTNPRPQRVICKFASKLSGFLGGLKD